MHLAVNGWSLAVEPATPFRYGLLENLQALTGRHPDVAVTLILPGVPSVEVPPPLQIAEVPAGDSAWQRLVFDQRQAPRTAASIGADLLLNPAGHAPLRSPVSLAVELGRGKSAEGTVLVERLRRAVGAAGALGAELRYGWEDQWESDEGRGAIRRLPPFVGDGFRPTDPGEDRGVRAEAGLPPEYVLCHGAEAVDLPLLLAAWTWVEGSVGETIPLVLLGLSSESQSEGRARAADLDMEDAVQWLPAVEPQILPAVYRGAEAMLHPGYSRRGQELRWALATGTPVAGVETPEAAAILGEAGYLVQHGHARALGAAALTLLVDRRDLAHKLREMGLLRARPFHDLSRVDQYRDALGEIVSGKARMA